MNQNKKYSPLRMTIALFVGIVIAFLLNVVDGQFNTHLYENYHTIAYVLIPVILAGILGANLWSYVKNRKHKTI